MPTRCWKAGACSKRGRSRAISCANCRRRRPPNQAASQPPPVASKVDVSRLVLSTLRSIRSHDATPLGSPYPDPSLFPWRRINQLANAIARRHSSWNLMDDLPPGNPELIRQIARRYAENGVPVDPDEIIITVGATEAINLSLQAVAKPGDTVAVESPTYYAMLHAIERLGMRAIEVPTHPAEGIDIDALAIIIREHKIAACMVMPNFQNPLGFVMSDANKERLVGLLAAHEIPVIENDVYQELYYGDARPSALKNFDKKGLVLHCASFSKSLTASYRIGWAMPGRYRRAGGKAQVPEHADHAVGAASRRGRLSAAGRLRPSSAACAQGVPAAGAAHDRDGPAFLSRRHAHVHAAWAAMCCGFNCRRASIPCSFIRRRSRAGLRSGRARCFHRAMRSAISSGSTTVIPGARRRKRR